MPLSLLSKMSRRLPLSAVIAESVQQPEGGLKKCLSLPQVISFGLSCTVGSGIFVTVGIIAQHYTGPALFLSMLIAIIGSLLSALCYAEFAAKIPAAGQAYTYCYVAMGEFWGFMSGWLSTVPYTISSAAVARGWANYLGSFAAAALGVTLHDVFVATPTVGYLFSLSLLAPLLVIGCTWLCLKGAEESANFSMAITIANVCLLLMFCFYGTIEYADPDNMTPFTLQGIGYLGVFKGAGLAFFCCVGWDAVCTLSEEVKDPQRDIPRGLIGTLGAVAVLYCALSVTLCLMVPSSEIDVKAPLSMAFQFHNDQVGCVVAAFAALTVCTPSVLGGIMGQPRIWYRMAMDGLLFESFGKLNSNDIPYVGTWVSGGLATVLALILDFEPLASTTSGATLLMLLMVTAGVIGSRFEEDLSLVTSSHATINAALAALNKELLAFCGSSVLFYILLLSEDDSRSTRLAMYACLALKVLFLLRTLSVWERRKLNGWTRADADGLTRSLLQGQVMSPFVTPGPNIDEITTAAGTNDDFPAKRPFRCPGMPYLPLVASNVNAYMFASLGGPAIVGCSIWITLGCFVYLGYSIHNSRLNR